METMKELRNICKPSKDDPLIGKIIYRKISIYFTRLFLYLKLSANMVSFLSAIVSLFGISFFLCDDIRKHLFGVIFVQLSIIFDYADGEVSRFKKHQEKILDENISGKYIDNIIHHLIEPLALFIFGLRCIQYFPNIIIGIAIISFISAVSLNGLPNLVAEHIIIDSLKRCPSLIENEGFRFLLIKKIDVFLNSNHNVTMFINILYHLAKIFEGIGVLFIITIDIIIENILYYLGYNGIANYLGMSCIIFLFVILFPNLLRTVRRNYLLLNKSF